MRQLTSNSPFLIEDNSNAIGAVVVAGAPAQRLYPYNIRSSSRLTLTVPAATFVTPTLDNNSGLVRLTSAGVHGLTAAAAVNRFVYVSWTGGKSGVDGFYSISSIDADTTGVAITLNLVASAAVTISNSATTGVPAVFTWANHGRAVGNILQFTTTGSLPTGVATTTDYYVRTVLDANTFLISATAGGTPISTTTAGSGTHAAVPQYGTATVKLATQQITLPQIAVPAGSVTRNGKVEINVLLSMTNSANAKVYNMVWNNATTFYASGNLTNVGTVQMNKIIVPYSDVAAITNAAAAPGHGTSTNAVTAITAANYAAAFTLDQNCTIPTANEFLSLDYYDVLCE